MYMLKSFLKFFEVTKIMRYKHTLTLLGITLPICVILRVLQSIFTIDSTTGFIRQQYTGISVLITVIIFAGVFSVGIMSVAAEGIKIKKTQKNLPLAIGSLLIGGMFIYASLALVSSTTVYVWYDTVQVLLGFISAFVFIFFGFKNIFLYRFPAILLVVPVFYYVIKLISIFVSTSALALVTENIFLLFTNASLLVFVLEFSKTENGIYKTPNTKKLFSSIVVSGMLCVVQSLPKLLVFGAYLSRRDMADALLTLAMGVFVILYVAIAFEDENSRKNIHLAKHLAE